MTKKRNLDIRLRAKEAGVKLYEIAERLGVYSSTFSVELRNELPDDRKKEIVEAIEAIRKENEEWTNSQTNS